MSILQMTGMSKSFDGNLVLDNVDLSVEVGQVHALLGENGAGKSTLLNILAGVLPADAGTIVFDGITYHDASINQMESAGLSFVHQELNIINDLTVSENIFFNHELTYPLGILKRNQMLAETQALFERFEVDIDPTAKVSDLKTGQKQMLEICRALHMDAKLMVFDEPTTALGNDEIDHLFALIRQLTANGKAVIFVSHKMPEIFAIADTYTVLRNGQLVSQGSIASTTPLTVTRDMVGEHGGTVADYRPRPLGDVVLEVNALSSDAFTDVSLTVRRGEIVALTGLAGCGASELLQAMFGAFPTLSGTIEVGGKLVTGSIGAFARHGIGMLPTNRKENSVIPDVSVLENVYLAEHCLAFWPPYIVKRQELERYDPLGQMLGIKAPNPDMSINSLSGGNQQKVFLARWLNTEADIMLFDNPTQGVDVGAKEDIYKLILDLADKGKTIVINTLEIPEIQKVSDRCVVLYGGAVVADLPHDAINEHDVMAYATNAIDTRS